MYFTFLSFVVAGLGMRVSGGKIGPDGKLGAFVTLVERDGPADSYGIKAGTFYTYFI